MTSADRAGHEPSTPASQSGKDLQRWSFDPPKGPLRRSAGRGAMLIAVSQGVKISTQIVSLILLSRLLAPEEFGIAAMAAPVVAFVGMFQSLGLSYATIQKETISAEEVTALFWINTALSLALAAGMVAVSQLAAAFYREPSVGPLIAAMALPILLFGLTTQHHAILSRRMSFGVIAVIDSAAAILGLVAAAAWALLAPSFWALYGGLLATALTTTALNWALAGWRPGPPRRTRGVGTLVNLGAGITGFNMANFVARNLDNMLIGRYLGETALGFYDRAYKLLLFPLQQIAQPLQRVMVPTLSRLVNEPERYRHAYLRVVCLMMLAVLPGVATATVMADKVVSFLLGDNWIGSAPIFQALGFAGLVQLLNNPLGWLFISQGRGGEFARCGAAGAITSAAAFVVGLPFGVVGVAAAYAVSEYLKTPFLWLYLGRRGPVRARHMLHAATPLAVGAAAVLVVLWRIDPVLPAAPLPAIVCATAAAYLTMLVVVTCFPWGRSVIREGATLMSLLRPGASAPARNPAVPRA